jgi:hypothetical protein
MNRPESREISAAVRDNRELSRFELKAGDEVAVAYYSRSPGRIILTHTEVPAALSGRGIGSELARGALEIARSEKVRVVATCPFIATYIANHPEFSDLLLNDGGD